MSHRFHQRVRIKPTARWIPIPPIRRTIRTLHSKRRSEPISRPLFSQACRATPRRYGRRWRIQARPRMPSYPTRLSSNRRIRSDRPSSQRTPSRMPICRKRPKSQPRNRSYSQGRSITTSRSRCWRGSLTNRRLRQTARTNRPFPAVPPRPAWLPIRLLSHPNRARNPCSISSRLLSKACPTPPPRRSMTGMRRSFPGRCRPHPRRPPRRSNRTLPHSPISPSFRANSSTVSLTARAPPPATPNRPGCPPRRCPETGLSNPSPLALRTSRTTCPMRRATRPPAKSSTTMRTTGPPPRSRSRLTRRPRARSAKGCCVTGAPRRTATIPRSGRAASARP